jgi:phage gp29-like protein
MKTKPKTIPKNKITKNIEPKIGTEKNEIILTNEKIRSKYNLDIRSPDEVLEFEGLEYYDKILARDPHLYSIMNTRKIGACSFPYILKPFNDTPEAKEQLDFMWFVLMEMKGDLPVHFKNILDAIPKGFSIHEIITKTQVSGRWDGKTVIYNLIFHKQKLFRFEAKPETGFKILFTDMKKGEEVEIPAQKLVHVIFEGFGNPYGDPLLEKAYWYHWFKKEVGLKFWGIFLERYGAPTAVIKYPAGETDSNLQNQALQALDDLQNEIGITLPDTFCIEFIKTAQGDISYRDLIDVCNAEMSKLVLGATQSVEEGRKGSYALSKAHSDVRFEYKCDGADLLKGAINNQIIKRIINLNFANPLPPIFEFVIPKTDPNQRETEETTIPEKDEEEERETKRQEKEIERQEKRQEKEEEREEKRQERKEEREEKTKERKEEREEKKKEREEEKKEKEGNE